MSTAALQKTNTEESDDRFLALIEKVIENPQVDADKLKVIVDLKLQLEDRAAEKAFDAAMQDAQKEVQALKWDKINPEKNSRYASYPKIDAMLKPIREKFGFSESFGVEPQMAGPDLMMMYSDVTHKDENGCHRRRYHLPMSISGEGPKGGGVMTAAQAVGNGSSLGMRYLEKMIWKIPMLVDKDDNDGNAPYETITESQAEELAKLAKETKSDLQKFCEYYKVDEIRNLPRSSYGSAVAAFKKKQSAKATISEKQAADLTALAEEVRFDLKKFCADNKIRSINDLPASAYSSAIKTLEEKRRA